ncbi:hypothetical protein [Paenibacillus rigui]|uniref:hypothetical protein n=1 Tax=Paenibacillus rigui TaxID=554312 RepID=UPI0015C58366|nr:hypothetical protein [Paenibacillus rigui]
MRPRNKKTYRRRRERPIVNEGTIETTEALSLSSLEGDSPLGPRKCRDRKAGRPRWRLRRIAARPADSKQTHRNPAKDSQERKSGEIAAVLVSIVFGMAVLTTVHLWSTAAPDAVNPRLLKWASWLPGGLRIGPYAGKEMAAALAWLASWALLHGWLSNKEVQLKRWLYGFLAAVFLLLLLLWPPVYHFMLGWPA